MKAFALIGTLFVLQACTTEKIRFEMGEWWQGHWQKTSDTSQFFSVGLKPVGPQNLSTTQFFFSTRDTIYSNFFLEELVDFNFKKGWKLIRTDEGKYIKILEIEEYKTIEVFGPMESQKDLDDVSDIYSWMPEALTPPFPDSILMQ